MKVFEGKTIMFGVPKLFNLDSMIEAELKAVGLNTFNISVHNNTFKYTNNRQRLESLLDKIRTGKSNYKQLLNFRESASRILAEIENVVQVDYILIIRPEIYPYDFLGSLKKKGKKMIGYQWNGLKRFPQTLNYIPLFDKFYVFDSVDLNTPNVFPTTNFYPTTIPNENIAEKTDAYYTGSYIRKRMPTLCDLISKFEALDLNVHYHLFAKRKKYFFPCRITTSRKTVSYEQNIQNTYNTDILLDITVAEHEGLSFRILEAVGFERKLITTNPRVHDYDFYHPDNILIWTSQSKEELAEFLRKPYVAIPERIKWKYSFKNWIQYMLDYGDYIPIELPPAK